MFEWFKELVNELDESRKQRFYEDEQIRKMFKRNGSNNFSYEELNELRPQYRKIMAEIKKKNEMFESLTIKVKGLMLNRVCYIDSNIFMNELADSFFRILDESDFLEEGSIIVIKEQYNELYKLKSANTDVSHKARLAFRRIEGLHSKKILRVNNLDKELKGSSYADIAFVDEINTQIKNGKLVTFFTEDLDLKIRLNSQISSLGEPLQSSLTIYSLKDITNIS